MVEFWIAATFWLGAPLEFEVNVSATFLLEAPFPVIEYGPEGYLAGFSLPFLIVVDSNYSPIEKRELVRHELGHARQWSALGPAFPALYALTFGHPFEDYQPSTTWHPPRNMENNCPLLRLTNTNWEVMPCWHLPF